MSPKKDMGLSRADDFHDEMQVWKAERRASREQEAVALNNDFIVREEQVRQELMDLWERKKAVETELRATDQQISLREQRQSALMDDFDRLRRDMTSRHEEEDRQHLEQLRRGREAAAAYDNANGIKDLRPKSNGRRASIRDLQSGGWTSINGARTRSSRIEEDDDAPPTDPGNLAGSGYQPMDEGDTNGREQDAALAVRLRKLDDQRPLMPKQRHSLPSFSQMARSPGAKPKEDDSVKSERSPSGRRSLPGARSQDSRDGDTPAPASVDEITRDTVVLKHNGTMYVEPEMYYGVPLERIDKHHPYWDSEWQPLEDIIQPQLEKWQEKLDTLRRTPEAVRHTVFLANRQVNRGQAVIDFLKDGDFHPYQYVGKEMMAKFYKTFVNYDTMFRLVNVHEELKKFELDITPLEWLRQRMYEVSTEQGDKFNLSKYTHDLYHDAKLKALREKHGFGNIGRPSGYKVGEKNSDKTKNKGKRESTGTARRKARRSIGQVDMDEPSMIEGYQQDQQDYLEPVTPRLQKRQRLETAPMSAPAPAPAPAEPEVDDLEYEGYTSTDSFSAGRIMHLDWRVYQIKTRTLTTSTEVTQYWTWKAEKNTFEHQVLRDVYPKVTWGVYQKPISFDLTLSEIIEMRYAPNCQKIVVRLNTEKRGNVLAHFKRERTKKRFLSFAQKKGVKLEKTTLASIEDTWNSMESDEMPGDDSES